MCDNRNNSEATEPQNLEEAEELAIYCAGAYRMAFEMAQGVMEALSSARDMVDSSQALVAKFSPAGEVDTLPDALRPSDEQMAGFEAMLDHTP